MTSGPLAEAFVRWQHAAGPYWQFVCATPFLADSPSPPTPTPTRGEGTPAGANLFPGPIGGPGTIGPGGITAQVGRADRAEAPHALVGEALGGEGTPAAPDLPIDRGRSSGLLRPRVPRALRQAIRTSSSDECTAFFVDLRIEATLPATTWLVGRDFYVVPVIQRWIADRSVLPGQRLIDQLTTWGRVVRRPVDPRGVAFLLDGDRLKPIGRREGATRRRLFDNRYEYPTCRFPPPHLLLREGIRAIRWVARSGVASDLVDYVATLELDSRRPDRFDQSRLSCARS